MALWTLEEARSNLNLWVDAQKAIALGQAYTIGTRSLTRANLSDVMKQIQFWGNEVEKLETGRSGARITRIVPRDL